ncbi:MAG: hypothetical protein ACJAYY_001028 [Paraglaciecola sp.]|jgi:hypothetical protein
MKINFYFVKMMFPKTADLVLGNCEPLAKKNKAFRINNCCEFTTETNV